MHTREPERRRLHAFFNYLFVFARKVITKSYLQTKDRANGEARDLAVSVSHALNPEAAFFGRSASREALPESPVQYKQWLLELSKQSVRQTSQQLAKHNLVPFIAQKGGQRKIPIDTLSFRNCKLGHRCPYDSRVALEIWSFAMCLVAHARLGRVAMTWTPPSRPLTQRRWLQSTPALKVLRRASQGTRPW